MHFNCYICHKQGNFWQDLKSICITKCGHIFHLNCLMMHVSSQSKSIIQCPITMCNKKTKQANIIQVDLTVVENENNYQINQPIGCSLCNDPLMDPINISVAKCGHLYHFICLAMLVKLKSNACMVSACGIKLTQAAVTQVHFIRCDVTPPETMTTGELRVLLDKNQQNKNDLEQGGLVNILDVDKDVTSLDVTQNQEIVKLKQQYKELEEQMKVLKKERDDAKKETAIWEMCFKYFQDQIKDTELMIPGQNTQEIVRENEKLKMRIQELNGDLKKLKEEIYLNPTIDLVSEIVKKHSPENDTLKELNNELPNENTRLANLNETLQKQHDILKNMNENLQTRNFELTELNKNYQELNKNYQEMNKTLQTVNKIQTKTIEPHIGSFILKELINIRRSFTNGNQGTSKRTFSEINNTAIEIQGNDISEEMLKDDLLNEAVLKQDDEDGEVTQELENEEVIKLKVENKEVITQEVENGEVILQNEENEEVITQEVENEEIIREEMENEEPEIKRMKLVLDPEIGDVPSISVTAGPT